MTAPERNYSATKREFLAMVKGIKHFRLYSCEKPIKLRTDHASSRWLCRKTEPTDQMKRWLELLDQFQCTIEQRVGPQLENADGLSSKRGTESKHYQGREKKDGGPSIAEVKE